MDEVNKCLRQNEINIATIKEHLATINGTIIKHEKGIAQLSSDIENNKIQIAKLAGIGGLSGGVVAGILMLFLKVLLLI